MLRFFSSVSLSLGLCLLAGCGAGGAPVKGEVAFGTLKMADGDKIVVLLETEGKSYSADVDSSGQFAFAAVAPGTYKVKVVHYLAAATPGEGKGSAPKSGAPAAGVGPPPSKGPPPGGAPSTSGPEMAGPMAPKDYPEEWTVPGGPFKLDLSKLKK